MNELVTIGIAKSDEEVVGINMSVEFLLDTKLTRELNSRMEFVTSFNLQFFHTRKPVPIPSVYGFPSE